MAVRVAFFVFFLLWLHCSTCLFLFCFLKQNKKDPATTGHPGANNPIKYRVAAERRPTDIVLPLTLQAKSKGTVYRRKNTIFSVTAKTVSVKSMITIYRSTFAALLHYLTVSLPCNKPLQRSTLLCDIFAMAILWLSFALVFIFPSCLKCCSFCTCLYLVL